jgi:photosystem II stability/assembly factor-like uncharacterized protein
MTNRFFIYFCLILVQLTLHLCFAFAQLNSSQINNFHQNNIVWERLFSGENKFRVMEIEFCRSNNSIIVLAGSNGLYRSSNGGLSWNCLDSTAAYDHVAIDPANPSVMVASYNKPILSSDLKITVNGGETWNSLSTFESESPIDFLEYDCSTEKMLYTRTATSFLRSSDLGVTWETIKAPILPRSIAIGEDNFKKIYISSSQGIFKSTDRGATWDSLPIATSGKYTTIFIDAHHSDTVYARVLGIGLYKSIDGGATWQQKTEGLERKNFIASATGIVSKKNNNEVFILADSCLYKSTNGGEVWKGMDTLPTPRIHALAFDTTGNGRVLIGSLNFYGIYSTSLMQLLAIFPTPTYPEYYYLHQNYPNPFNPSTTIRYQIPKEGMVTLKVYDLLGKELAELVNGRKSPGLHSVDFHAGSYSSGVYFYELRSGSFIETKKLVLMR